MKKISTEQITAVLQEVYTTNISAQKFDVLKQFFANLPEIEEEKPEKK